VPRPACDKRAAPPRLPSARAAHPAVAPHHRMTRPCASPRSRHLCHSASVIGVAPVFAYARSALRHSHAPSPSASHAAAPCLTPVGVGSSQHQLTRAPRLALISCYFRASERTSTRRPGSQSCLSPAQAHASPMACSGQHHVRRCFAIVRPSTMYAGAMEPPRRPSRPQQLHHRSVLLSSSTPCALLLGSKVRKGVNPRRNVIRGLYYKNT